MGYKDAVQDSSDLMTRLHGLGERFQTFCAALERPVVFFDIEATGTDPLMDRLIELACLKLYPGKAPATMHTWRVHPQMVVPDEAIAVHGITNDMLADAPLFHACAKDIAAVFEGADVAGFNVGRYDVRMLQAEFVRVGMPLDLSASRVLDVQVIFHQREPRNLSAAVQFYCGKPLENAHGAEADTFAALEVFAGQLERYGDLGHTMDALHQLYAGQNELYCDTGRRFVWKNGEPAFNFGRLRGKSLRWAAADPTERKYLQWFLDNKFEEDAKALVADAIAGKIRRRTETGGQEPVVAEA